MSYILDALKRADAQRERGQVPGLGAQPVALAAVPATRSRLGWWVGLACGAAAVAAGAATPTASAPTAAIQLLTGANAGKELELTKTLTTLGKPGVQVAVIARRPHGFFITHVEGAQFPIVNGNVLDAQAHQLADHDVIEIAGIKMEFFFKT